MSFATRLLAHVGTEHPRSLRGVQEARAVDPELFDAIADRFLGWAAGVHGEEEALRRCVTAFEAFSHDVLFAQARYEADGHYENSSFAECEATVYADASVMDDYLWGVFLTNFCWAHHMEISRTYLHRFVRRLQPDASVLEIAPGHGGWGVWLLTEHPSARLEAFDISPSSINIATSIATAAGVADRATYTRRDAMDLGGRPGGTKDAVLCSFLIEHLEEPQRLVDTMAHELRKGGTAWLTGALTAAQVDHIYEFVRESELVAMCEQAGFRVVETISVAPQRLLPKARYLPRSMGLLLEKR